MTIEIILKVFVLCFILLAGYAIWRWNMEGKALIEWGDGKKMCKDESTDIWRGDHFN